MKRWRIWLAVPAVFSIWILAVASRNPSLLQDSDTAVLLRNLAERNNAWSWFGGDWPLFNHFYRPVSTLFFEYDRLTHPGNDSAFGFTNAVICALCLWAAFWLFCEFTQDFPLASLATTIFGIAHVMPNPFATIQVALWIALWIPLLGFLRGPFRKKAPAVLGAMGALLFLTLILPSAPLEWKARIMDWLPGRTASTMTLFALLALAAFARYVRVGSEVRQGDPSPFDIPPTRSSAARRSPEHRPGWLAASVLFVALAFGCYEQAVMIPALVTGIAVTFALRRFHPIRWWSIAPHWALLAGYLVLRSNLVPSDVSGYQAQQLRSGPGVWLDVGFYLFPSVSLVPAIYGVGAAGALVVFLTVTYILVGQIAGNVYVWITILKNKCWLIVSTILLAFFAYLPMGWLKFFGHYHYFPGVFFSLFVAQMIIFAAEQMKRAIAPPGVRAVDFLSTGAE